MAMTECKECGQGVSSNAKVCPHCGIKKPYQKAKPPPPELGPVGNMIAKVITAVVMVSIVGGIGYLFFGGGTSDVTRSNEWYNGGSLHGSNFVEWSDSDYRNKVATASDWLVTVLGSSEVKNMASLKQKSRLLVKCVDELIPVISKSYKPSETKTRATGLLCITKFNERGWW